MGDMTATPFKKKTFSYYDFRKLLSYNGTYNFLLGARGLGKTYGSKKMAIKSYLRNGSQFIYLRRYKTELASKQTFFDDIAHEFPEHGFRVYGSEAQITHEPHDEKAKWHTIGYFVALSQSQSRKSVAYPRVTLIIFDEFIIEKGSLHYLPSEYEVFNNFYATVDRWQDKTRVLFMANSVTIMNPYFIEYDIRPDKEWTRIFDGFMVVHFADGKKFASEVMQTKFGKFIQGTGYEQYAVNSVFADNHDALVMRKKSEAVYYCTIETTMGAFSVWVDSKTQLSTTYHIQEARPKKETIYVLEMELMAEGKTLVPYNDKFLQYLRAAFNRGTMFFDGPRTRNMFAKVFKR